MKIKIIAGILVLTLISTLFFNNKKEVISLCGLYISFDNLVDLEKNSDLIIVGEPLDKFEKRNHKVTYFDDGETEDFYTLTKIKVDNILMNRENDVKNGDIIEIVEPIALIDNQILTTSDYKALEREKYVIFLRKNIYKEYSIINMNEGKFKYNHKYKNYDKKSLEYQVYEKYIKNKEVSIWIKKY